ncbi:hypothetical protein [Bosea sp. UC22_33]|uniref:calcium-binding protein n=1 Tax=Bosea sp. UC22_33 TaxID=3350165 RepID=UPI00366D24C2
MAIPGQQNKIYGTAKSDFLRGSSQDDSIFGGDRSDILLGKKGNDYIDGGNGNDLLFGGDGDDWLLGGGGDDILIGGCGADQFRFDGAQVSGCRDTDVVADLNFSQGDKLVVYGFKAGTFDDKDGITETGIGNDLDITVPYPVNPARYGEGFVADSVDDLVELVKYSTGATAQKGFCNALILKLDDGVHQQTIVLNGWADAFVTAGGAYGI